MYPNDVLESMDPDGSGTLDLDLGPMTGELASVNGRSRRGMLKAVRPGSSTYVPVSMHDQLWGHVLMFSKPSLSRCQWRKGVSLSELILAEAYCTDRIALIM